MPSAYFFVGRSQWKVFDGTQSEQGHLISYQVHPKDMPLTPGPILVLRCWWVISWVGYVWAVVGASPYVQGLFSNVVVFGCLNKTKGS